MFFAEKRYRKIFFVVVGLIGTALFFAWFFFNKIAHEDVRVDKVYFDSKNATKQSVVSKLLPKKDRNLVSLNRQGGFFSSDKPTMTQAEKDARSCHGDKKIVLDNGSFSCKNSLSFALPEMFTEDMVKDRMVEVANRLYPEEESNPFTFKDNAVGNMIVVKNTPPEGSLLRPSDVYIGTLVNKEGKITAVMSVEKRGVKNGEAQFEFHDMHPQGDAYHKLPDARLLSDPSITLEQLQVQYRYPFESFPPVTEAMSEKFVQSYFEEKGFHDMQFDRVGYTSVYDYRGRLFGSDEATAFYEYSVTDGQGNQSAVLVNINDGRVVDQNYLQWLTDANDYNEAHAKDVQFVEYDVPAPQSPRFEVQSQSKIEQ